MNESSFETLEALAQAILEELKRKHGEAWRALDGGVSWAFGVELKKPIAVPFAEAACVELRGRTE